MIPATLHAALDEMEAAVLSQARAAGGFHAGDEQPATAGAAGPGAALIATSDPGTAQRLLVAGVEAASGAGLAQDGGFHLIQRRVQGGGDQGRRGLGRVLAGKQPGGVGCRDDDRREASHHAG